MSSIGYIYIREHSSYDKEGVCKLGKTTSCPERDSLYATGEVRRGYFSLVFEVPVKQLSIIERLLQQEFSNLNIKYDAGIEFYDKKIMNMIEPYLQSLRVKYKRLSRHEISSLVRCNRVRNVFQKVSIRSLIQAIKNTKCRRTYQATIIGKAVAFFQKEPKGLLVLPCGVGKTLISLWIAQELGANTIVIGVPNKLLLHQWKDVVCDLFPRIPHLLVKDGVETETITRFIGSNTQTFVVITTYASSYKVKKATGSFVFDIKINDEAHHLTSRNMALEQTTKTYIEMLKIRCVKQISLTATLKQLQSEEDMVSNDNIDLFGPIIEKRCLLWAIKEKIICDYVIQTLITSEEQLEPLLTRFHITNDTDKRLFLSAFATLKSLYDGYSHHVLIYSNSKENSLKVMTYIGTLMSEDYFKIPDLYYSHYHGDMRSQTQNEIVDQFRQTEHAVISCVYCLGEGWDFPILDAVVFAENMTSNIRIVQSALRACRKNNNEPNKTTKIILPVLNRDDWLDNNENTDLKKVREVIYQMGLEDETITQKIRVYHIDVEKREKEKTDTNNKQPNVDEFGEYDDELTTKLRLKTLRRSALSTSYEQARKIIKSNNIRNKKEYLELCGRDHRLTTEPDIVFRGKFTNWVDYLGIDRTYYELDDCRQHVSRYVASHPDWKKHYMVLSVIVTKLCDMDPMFPPDDLWVDYYNVNDLQDIISFTSVKRKRNII